MKREPKKLIKRILAMALALVLVFGVLPNARLTGVLRAEAAEIERTDFQVADGEYGDSNYNPLTCSNPELKYEVLYQIKGEDGSYSDYTDTSFIAGEYKAIVTLIDGDTFENDDVTSEYTFKVYSQDISSEYEILLSSESGFISEGWPDVTVQAGSNVLSSDNYEISYQLGETKVDSISEIGTYTIVVSGKGNYSGSIRKQYLVCDSNDSLIYEGSFFTEDYYNGNVVVKSSIEGEKISETPNFTSADTSLTYTSSASLPAYIYVQHEDGSVSKSSVTTFTIDTEKPDLNVKVNTTEWAKEKIITVSNGRGLYKDTVYYSVGEIENDNLFQDGAKLTSAQKDEVEQYISDSIIIPVTDNKVTVEDDVDDESALTYYFYAIDLAGNISVDTIDVSKVDKHDPRISGILEAVWTQDGTYTTNFTARDDFSEENIQGSGIEKVDSDNSDAVVTSDGNQNYTLEISTPGTYTITAADQAGNTSSVSITVKKDSAKPEFTEEKVVNSAKKTVENENGSYIFSDTNDKLTVSFEVVDEAADGEEKSNITVKCRNEVIKSVNGIYTYEIETEGTFIFTVEDEAGNTDEFSISASKCEQSTPDLKVTLGDDAVLVGEEYYFNSQTDSGINAELSDTVGVASVSYEICGQNETIYSGEEDYCSESGVYMTGQYTAEAYEGSLDGIFGEDFKNILKGLSDGSYTAKITVTNVIGTSVEDEVTFKIDKTDPEENAYVEYESDPEDIDEYYASGIVGTFSKIKDAISRIFGKSVVGVTIYVKDGYNKNGVSGIDVDDLIGKVALISSDEHVSIELNKDTTTENIAVDGEAGSYTAIKGIIRNSSSDSDSISQIAISGLKDNAGNEISSVEINDGDNVEFIIIDNVSPDISVTYPDATGTGDGQKFYAPVSGDQQYEVVTLVYTERFFAENVETDDDGNVIADDDGNEKIILPKIQVNDQVVDTEKSDDLKPYVEWTTTDSTTGEAGKMTATLYLPYSTDEEGGEIEYVISTNYQDGSENVLVRNTDDGFSKIKDGTYTSNTLILDNRAPELTEYSISGTTDRQIDGVDVYHNVENKGDVTISFTVDDNDTYWNPAALKFVIQNKTTGEDSVVICGDADDITWEENGRLHTAEYTFNGEENVAAEYYVTVSYADKAGNMLISAVDEDKNSLFDDISDGTYTSAEFILDHAAPIFNISYNNAYRLVKDSKTSSANDKKDSVPETGYTAYYGEAEEYICVTVEITEDYAVVDKAGDKITALTDFVLKINDSMDNLPAIEWTYDENTKTYTGEFYLTEEGYYNIEASYHDAAANNMAAGDEVQGSETNTKVDGGAYKSTELVIDQAAPKIKVSYDSAVVNTVNNRNYFAKSVNMTIAVTDNNIRNQELKDSMSAANAYLIQDSKTNIWDSTEAGKQLAAVDGKEITRNETGVESFSKTYSFALSTEANCDLLIQGYEDLAGNKAVIEAYNPYICVDYSAPSDLQIDYSVSGATFLDKVNYKLHGYAFADNKLTVTASAEDKIGGIHTFKFKVTDEDGNVTEILRTMNPVYNASESIELPLKNADFKGSVEVTVTDWSDNSSVKQQGQIVESSAKHNSTGSAVITTYTKPSRTVNGVDYYNTNVAFNLKLKDIYSGISSYQYTAGSQISEKDSFRDKAGTDLSATAAQSIINEVNKDLTLVASANNQNDVKVQASYVDNAGHTGSVEQTYNIDITAPTIQVTYDNNNPANEKYYKDNRTATVVITERNFDPNDVVFSITNTDGVMPSISGWTTTGTGDNTKHTARVSFTADGDYTFTVECQDLAGNKSRYGVVDEFTIDKTIPTYTVSYDNNSFRNQYYYDANRVATIDILEHNFDASAVNITVTKDGASVTPVVSGWSKNGDHNIATVSFSADGEYTFTFSGVDMAENSMTDYTLDHFVVDTENPEIEIFNIENMSANKDVVQPGIRYNDTNYDANATEVEMTGYHNGVVEMNGQRTVSNTGVEVLLNDFEHIQEMDDLYTMHATVYDLAGNSSEAEVIFSVNRFGSVYTFDDATDALVGEDGKYYTNKEQDIVVYETNVDTLEFQEITCNLNGELSTLKEGEDFTVSESGSQETWKQYTYKIAASNFENEGTYALTIYSEDRAENTSDNNSKGKKVEFVVDKTDPTIKISGVDEGATYKEEAHEVTIAVDDNVLLSSVKVDLDGETIQEFNTSDIEAENGILSFDVQSKNSTAAQAMVVSAVDAAGNSFHTDGVNFWVTTNILILYFAHKGIFFGTIAGAAAVIAVVIGRFYIIPAKKKSDDEEDQ